MFPEGLYRDIKASETENKTDCQGKNNKSEQTKNSFDGHIY